MVRAIKAIVAAFCLATAPVAVLAGSAHASELSDAYNNQTDRNFRIGMQMRLAWTGDYAGDFSGTVDAASLRAIRDFQARHGMEASGVIDETFLSMLVARSDGAQKAVGFQLVTDRATGARIALPLGLVSDAGETPIGRVWRSSDKSIEVETVRLTGADQTLDAVHSMLVSGGDGARTILSDIKLDDGFALRGLEGDRTFVMRFRGVDGDVRGFGISYAPDAAEVIQPYASVAANLFDPAAPADSGPSGDAIAVVDPNPFNLMAVEGRRGERGERPSSSLFSGERAAAATRAAPDDASSDTDSSGSGFVVADGWVLTNAHVAGSCKSVLVGDKGVADKILVDSTNDLALVHVSATLAKPLAIAAGTPRLGEDVLALGFPLRSILADSLNVTRGNVSSLLGLQNDARYLQISAPVQPGNSGGPLVDLSGRVVGVVTAKLDAVAIADATGDIPQAINFAIRPDAAASFLEENGIEFRSAPAPKSFASVADTTADVQDAVMPILCLGGSHG